MCVIFSLLILVGFLHLVEISLLVVLCFLFPVCFSNVKNVKYLMMFFVNMPESIERESVQSLKTFVNFRSMKVQNICCP